VATAPLPEPHRHFLYGVAALAPERLASSTRNEGAERALVAQGHPVQAAVSVNPHCEIASSDADLAPAGFLMG